MGILCIFCTEISREWLFTKTSMLWDLQNLSDLLSPCLALCLSLSLALFFYPQSPSPRIPPSHVLNVLCVHMSVFSFLFPLAVISFHSSPLGQNLSDIFQLPAQMPSLLGPNSDTPGCHHILSSTEIWKELHDSFCHSVLLFVYAHETDFLDKENMLRYAQFRSLSTVVRTQMFPYRG